MINRYKSQQLPDTYVYDRLIYNSPIELVIDGFFGFCGCGQPEEAFEYIRNVLNMLNSRPPHNSEAEREDWQFRWNRLVGSAEMFTLYVLTNVEIDGHHIIEHGGSVGGSWLTPHGEEFLADLNKIKI